MPTEAMRAQLARKALNLYLGEHTAERRWRYPVAGAEVAECDIVDLMTDLLILARRSGYDPCAVLRKTQVHLKAEVGESC
ncbi:hypothetical protein [Methylobacterium longum]|uniref:Uncharacterized protein n=1 Tax=Methylobacterium longum TaxID=767694 RepID=A0ABT8ALD0_9HYPH|nr:hypothetical protein [Methylobacterium longum]MDN3570415.1 hypothetical protein [Methylobacterium longum]GJE11415.1 hypothetical protein FOHLNKBM_2458 [Methylobacterium longum]